MEERINRKLWLEFPELVSAVQQDLKEMDVLYQGPHSFLHALMVAQYGWLIAEEENIAIAVWVAGLCHDLHRHCDNQIELVNKLDYYLTLTGLDESVKPMIKQAVLNHDNKPNDPADNPVTVALKDADRLGNIGPAHWPRAGQFRPCIPVFDPVNFLSDPEATFKNPRSICRDIRHTMEWESWLRLPRAKEIGKPYFEAIRWFLKTIEKQHADLGLFPPAGGASRVDDAIRGDSTRIASFFVVKSTS